LDGRSIFSPDTGVTFPAAAPAFGVTGAVPPLGVLVSTGLATGAAGFGVVGAKPPLGVLRPTWKETTRYKYGETVMIAV
jgi:hypothetical protein